MRSYRLYVIVAAILMMQVLLFAEPQWLGYHTSDQAREIIGNMSSQSMKFRDKPSDVNMPEIISKEPKFARWKTSMDKVGYRWVLLDQKKDLGFYDTLYVDCDGDGHLDDESPIKGVRDGRYYIYFDLAGVKFETEDGPVTYHVKFRYLDYGERDIRLSAYAGCWYQGEIEVDGKVQTCFLVDYNANGSFDDKSEGYSCDRILLGSQENREDGFVGKYIELNDKLYKLNIPKDGAFVEFTEASDVAYAEVKMAENINEFSAAGKNGLFKRKPTNGVVKLPLGVYRIYSWQINRNDSDGVEWSLQGSWFRDNHDFTVSENSVAKLDIGEPVISNLDVSMRGNEYYFNQRLKGRLDENISLTRGGSRPEAPSVNIKNKAGDYDRTFALEYG